MKLMTKRFSAIAGYLIALCLGAIVLSACSKKDDTEAIRQLIVKGAVLAEKKQLGDLMDLATPEFIALPGNHDAQTAKGILFGAFMHYGKFKIHFPRPTVEMASDGNSADATVHFLIVRQNQSIPGLKELYDDPRKWMETVGEKADLYQLKLAMVKDGGEWLVNTAELEGF
jgi:hypothetical protein